MLVAGLGHLPNLFELFVADVNARPYAATRGRKVIDRAGLVPHEILPAQLMQQHHHQERIDHRVQRAPEMSSDIVAVGPAQAHVYGGAAKIRRDVLHTNARAQKRRP